MIVPREVARRALCATALLAAVLSTPPGLAQTGEPTKLLRFPDLSGDRIAFTYAGDIWLASTDGGTATRLTSHPGLELFAKFSPDGSDDRLHRPVRRRRAGLRRSRRRAVRPAS